MLTVRALSSNHIQRFVMCALFALAAAAPRAQAQASCALSVTENTYDQAAWWGTITFRNDLGRDVSDTKISFSVPANATCDFTPEGWTAQHSGRHCVYTNHSLTIAAGELVSFNYSATSQQLTAAGELTVSAQSCGDSGIGWRTANLTNYTSYPDPGSEECIEYNGCTWAGYFAGVEGQQTEDWVREHNIIAVHSKDYAAYGLKTLRLRKNGKTIDATVYDMCADSDCDGCCTANSQETGFLIDIEKYTMERFGEGDGVVQWLCADCN